MKVPILERSEEYEAMASTWQTIQVMELNTVLRKCGIKDVEKRRKICEEYSEAIGDIADQCAFKFHDTYLYPMLCFSPEYLYEGNEVEDISKMHVRSKGWRNTEHSCENVDDVFSDIFRKIRPHYKPFEYPDEE